VSERSREPSFEVRLVEDPPTVLYAERLRDGRVALGTRVRGRDGAWEPGELHLLEPPAYLGLASWLAGPVEDAWIDTVRARQDEPLRTVHELYGDEPGGVERLTEQVLREIPRELLVRAFILLANAIGPDSRARLVERLNRTDDVSEDAELRRRLADEHEAFAYVVAAAALFDAMGAESGAAE
jgi:hypothetical protein